MKFTYNWLKEFLDTNATLGEVAETLTQIGLEVEGVEDFSERLKDFVVAKIESASPHPNASKLQVCEVNDGSVTRQIVCGASNARAGIFVVLAREGVVIPANGMVIKKTKIRDVESSGMLCSLEELGLAESAEGIVELLGNPTLGSAAAAALGFDDAVIDIAITPNRGDCFGVYGVARDLAAAGLGTLKAMHIPNITTTNNHPAASIEVTTNTPACTYFVGCTIRGVKNVESPDWLKRRLIAIGQRPISALVDVTNYMLITFGRPLHAYDLKALNGNIQARHANEGETLKTLNGEEYTLKSSMCVIADAEKALGIGGIMGGEASGCQMDTTDVFLESALFAPISIANTGRQLELLSDARQRFERGVDGAFVKKGAELARDLILELCGGEASALVEAGSQPSTQAVIHFNPEKVFSLTGVDVPAETSEKILSSLGFVIKKSGSEWSVSAPAWRHDVSVAEDLVEEIIRIHGYQHIPLTALPPSLNKVQPTPFSEQRAHVSRKLLTARGMVELCNWSFVSRKQAEDFGVVKPELELLNPISSDLSVMRPSLLPHLLLSAMRNSNKGSKNLALFETGLVFSGVQPNEQQMMASGLRAGSSPNPVYDKTNYTNKPRSLDVFDAKADAYALLSALGVNVGQISLTADVPKYYHPSRAMALTLGGKIILGYAGELHPALAQTHDLDGRVAIFEIFLEAIPQAKNKSTSKKPLILSQFPDVSRDFAFTVNVDVSVEAIKRAVNKAEKQLLSSVEVFDVYSGKGTTEGQKSVAIKVTLQPNDHTLTDDEIQAVSKAIVDSVAASTGGSLRA